MDLRARPVTQAVVSDSVVVSLAGLSNELQVVVASEDHPEEQQALSVARLTEHSSAYH